MALKILFGILFVLSLGLSLLLGWSVYTTGLLPPQITVVAVCVLVLVPMLLFLLQREKKGENRKKGLRIFGVALLLIFSIVELVALPFIREANSALDKITDGDTKVTVVRVYVKQADPAQDIVYAVENDYRFGRLSYADLDAVGQLQQDIEQECGKAISVQDYGTLQDLMRALEEGELDALLLSTAHFGLIDSLPDYADYAETMRWIKSSDVQTRIQTPPTPEVGEAEAQEQGLRRPELWENSFCAYISGIDTYGPVTTSSRSDVNILAIVNKETKTVLLVFTPRDYYVPFPFLDGGRDKLTHAGNFGVDASMQVLGDFYGLPIQYFLRVNFSGFLDIINTLGGVDVESDMYFTSDLWKENEDDTEEYVFYEGTNHLSAKAALYFARCRSFPEGDRVRGRHQMAVIKGVIKGLASPRMLNNYSEVLESLSGSFQTNAPKSLIGELAQLTMDTSKDWTVLTYSVNGQGTSDYAASLGYYAYMMEPYPETVDYARQLMETVAAGESLTQERLDENAPQVTSAG